MGEAFDGLRVVRFPQEVCGPEAAARILALEDTAWPPGADVGEGRVFPTAPQTHATSFVAFSGERAVCHVGVRTCPLRHRGRDYVAYGLSEVVTHPAWRGRGLASRLVRRAAAFIEDAAADVSMFTCAPDLVPFYRRFGWEPLAGGCLVGGTPDRPFRSDGLGLVTVARFHSALACKRRADFEYADLALNLGESELW